MALIKSISGIRGTIGGRPGENLTPLDIVKFTAAYGSRVKEKRSGGTIVIGRDGRISGEMVSSLVTQTLLALGLHVVDLGLSTTPTVEMAVCWEKADGGIIITASHNPREWNALKLLNAAGEFISGAEGAVILDLAERSDFFFAPVEKAGNYQRKEGYEQRHITAILEHPLVTRAAIAKENFHVVVDGINSSGSIVVPALLRALGVTQVSVLNAEVNGMFAHNPEPLPEHLTDLSEAVRLQGADLGIAVDPDVDRLCFVCEDGSLFGEEYTLVAVADYVLSIRKGNTVSNMSSTSALQEITERHGGHYAASAVGEVNVVARMKETGAVIGGEGNGGIILPDLHYGRDALAGIGLFLSALAAFRQRQRGVADAGGVRPGGMRSFRRLYPDYYIYKGKMELSGGTELASLLAKVKKNYAAYSINEEDGLKILFPQGWVHLRGSNTEPIIRIYAEGRDRAAAEGLAEGVIQCIG